MNVQTLPATAAAVAALGRRALTVTPASRSGQLGAESFLNGTSSVYVEEMFRAWKANPAR